MKTVLTPLKGYQLHLPAKVAKKKATKWFVLWRRNYKIDSARVLTNNSNSDWVCEGCQQPAMDHTIDGEKAPHCMDPACALL
jgi:hypothetical protein